MYKVIIRNIILVLSLATLIGCKPVKEIVEVPVEVIKTEYKTEYIHDSTYVHDSTFIYMKGDTVFSTKYQLKYIERRVHDTLITHDTIPQVVNTETTVVKEVNKPQWWPVWLALGIILSYLILTKTSIIKYIKNFLELFK